MRLLLRNTNLLIVLAVMLPRMAWFAYNGGHLPEPARDQGTYTRIAEDFARGNGLRFSRSIGWLKYKLSVGTALGQAWSNHPGFVFGLIPIETPTAALEPGYPVLLGLFFAVTGQVSGSVFLLNSIMALLGAFAILRMVTEQWGGRQGILAALIWSLYPYYIYYTAYAMSDSLHISMLPVVAWLTLRAGSRGKGGAAAGFATGALFLVRSIALFVLPLQAGFLMLRRRWKTLPWLAGAFLLCCVPWVVRNMISMGRPVLMPTKASINLWMRNNPEILALEGIELPGWVEKSINRPELLPFPALDGVDTELERNDIIQERAVEFMLANPILIGYLTVVRLWMFISPFGSTVEGFIPLIGGIGVYLPMLLLSIVEFIHRRKDRRVLFLVSIFVLYTAIHSLAHGGVRYRLPVDMVLIVLTSLFFGRRLGWENADR